MKRRAGIVSGEKGYLPNTFIGGVSSVLNTPFLVSQKMVYKDTLIPVTESEIKGLKVIGSNIEFFIDVDYDLILDAFAYDLNITYYIDLGLKAHITNNLIFREAVNFNEAKFNASTTIGGSVFYKAPISIIEVNNANVLGFGCFRETDAISINLPSFSGVLSGSVFRDSNLLENLTFGGAITSVGSYCFYNTSLEDFIYFSNLTSIGNFAFYNTSNLNKPVVNNIITSLGTSAFQGSGITLFNSTSLTSAGSGCFRNCTDMTSFSAPLTVVGNQTFRNTSVEVFDFPNATSVEYGAFAESSNATEINIIKSLTLGNNTGDNIVFFNIKTGCLIRVNIALATNNLGGADGDLIYAKDTRGCTIEFYDDAGDYVSTL
ncbi:leucine-rich repeat domain-containing protein [Formosa undariae]|uniref:Leucine-rich repeat domain-containing protein n=1 Tax=Formosa undariae TaxID=1325436 RepID=A0ABV5F6G3_9FLAO